MGLNMGIEVNCYPDLEPRLPDPKAVEREFFDFLGERFPNCLGGGWVSRRETKPLGGDVTPQIEWDFDVRPFGRGSDLLEAGFTYQQVYAAIFEFIIERFTYNESFDCHVYWSA